MTSRNEQTNVQPGVDGGIKEKKIKTERCSNPGSTRSKKTLLGEESQPQETKRNRDRLVGKKEKRRTRKSLQYTFEKRYWREMHEEPG